MSFLEILPEDLVVSSVKKAEDPNFQGFVLRLYNPTEQDIDGHARLMETPEDVWQVTMEERFLRRPDIQPDGAFKFHAGPKQILTFKIKY
jgi:alpha-mannosidase